MFAPRRICILFATSDGGGRIGGLMEIIEMKQRCKFPFHSCCQVLPSSFDLLPSFFDLIIKLSNDLLVVRSQTMPRSIQFSIFDLLSSSHAVALSQILGVSARPANQLWKSALIMTAFQVSKMLHSQGA